VVRHKNSFALPSTYHFQNFNDRKFNKKGNKVWKGMSITLIWGLWNQRNYLTLQNEKVDLKEIFSVA